MAAFPGAPAFGAATAPGAGTYSSWQYVASATGSGCELPVGTTYGGHLTWPGAGKNGAVWRYQIADSSGPEVESVTYPKTPAATSTSWSGSAPHLYEPSGETYKETFEATLTYINVYSFVIKVTATTTSSAGGCTDVIYGSLIRE
jgi:hypothetical protein